VYITNITLEDDNKNIDDNLSNFVLKHDNTEVAMNKTSNGKYLSFQLANPVMIGENETENFKIFADVNDGAGDKISLFIDENIYVRGYDKRYGFGLRVDFGANPYCSGAATDCQEFVIDAGEITLAENKAIADEIRPDRDNNVLASFDLNINSGKDLSLEDIKFVIEGDLLDTGTYGDDIFEDVELHITVDGTTRSYDLDSSADSAVGITFSDRDL
jgi:hypothetical protein